MQAAIYGIEAKSLSDDEKYLLKNSTPYGLILFSRNIEEEKQVIDLTREIKSFNPDIKILIDEEGGRITRLDKIYSAPLTSAQELGDLFKQDEEKGTEAIINTYTKIADRLKKLGINVACSPVCDLGNKITHQIIGNRAFSNDPDIVIKTATIAADTLLRNDILPIIKHIPGHGRATSDSHLELPVINTDLAQLENSDFKIFKAMSKYPLAMTAHIIYQTLDPELPVTLSKPAMDYIKDVIGYQGKIMSDDINMKALKRYSLEEIISFALNAGCNYILHCDGNYDEMSIITEILNKKGHNISEQAS